MQNGDQGDSSTIPRRSYLPRMVGGLLALLGFLDALYLSLSRLHPENPLFCPSGGGCEAVERSPWSTIPPGGGIPVALLGVIGYVVLLGGILLALQRDYLTQQVALPPLLFAFTTATLLFSCYLMVVQVWMIRALCFWCLVSFVLQVGIWIALGIDWWSWRSTRSP